MIQLKEYTNEYGLPNYATFSDDGKYRYSLSRDWAEDGKIIVFILLNPSIGNEKILETTTAGCMKRAQAWGYTGMIVLNLFAYISTDPKELKHADDPVGEFNNEAITNIIQCLPDDGTIIAAWGNHGKLLDRDKEVLGLLENRNIYCLGVNKDGSPRHPLHMSHSIQPELWRGVGGYRIRS